MNLEAIRTEIADRGFDFDDSTTRLDYWINRAYHQFCTREAWPFLETTTTGSSPLTITNLRAALSVVDTTNDAKLSPADIRSLSDEDPTLDATGYPESWYMDGSALTVYPSSSSVSLAVRYIKVPEDLSSNSDEPIIPVRFHYALVDGALVYAYRDTDNFEAAAQTREAFNEAIIEATEELLVVNFDSASSIQITSSSSTDW